MARTKLTTSTNKPVTRKREKEERTETTTVEVTTPKKIQRVPRLNWETAIFFGDNIAPIFIRYLSPDSRVNKAILNLIQVSKTCFIRLVNIFQLEKHFKLSKSGEYESFLKNPLLDYYYGLNITFASKPSDNVKTELQLSNLKALTIVCDKFMTGLPPIRFTLGDLISIKLIYHAPCFLSDRGDIVLPITFERSNTSPVLQSFKFLVSPGWGVQSDILNYWLKTFNCKHTSSVKLVSIDIFTPFYIWKLNKTDFPEIETIGLSFGVELPGQPNLSSLFHFQYFNYTNETIVKRSNLNGINFYLWGKMDLITSDEEVFNFIQLVQHLFNSKPKALQLHLFGSKEHVTTGLNLLSSISPSILPFPSLTYNNAQVNTFFKICASTTPLSVSEQVSRKSY